MKTFIICALLGLGLALSACQKSESTVAPPAPTVGSASATGGILQDQLKNVDRARDAASQISQQGEQIKAQTEAAEK